MKDLNFLKPPPQNLSNLKELYSRWWGSCSTPCPMITAFYENFQRIIWHAISPQTAATENYIVRKEKPERIPSPQSPTVIAQNCSRGGESWSLFNQYKTLWHLHLKCSATMKRLMHTLVYCLTASPLGLHLLSWHPSMDEEETYPSHQKRCSLLQVNTTFTRQNPAPTSYCCNRPKQSFAVWDSHYSTKAVLPDVSSLRFAFFTFWLTVDVNLCKASEKAPSLSDSLIPTRASFLQHLACSAYKYPWSPTRVIFSPALCLFGRCWEYDSNRAAESFWTKKVLATAMHLYPACDQRNSESSKHSLQVFHCFSTLEHGYWEAVSWRWSIHVTRKLLHFADVSPWQISNRFSDRFSWPLL